MTDCAWKAGIVIVADSSKGGCHSQRAAVSTDRYHRALLAAVLMFGLLGCGFTSLARANVFILSATNQAATCPAGDSLTGTTSHAPRVRVTIRVTGPDTCGPGPLVPSCYPPLAGVPPERVWLQATATAGNVNVWDQPLRIYADDSTNTTGETTVTLPSVSGCGTLRLAAYELGEPYDSVTITVRSVDTNADSTVDIADKVTPCDLNYDGQVNSLDTDIIDAELTHWHRQALFGTPVRRTPVCDGCEEEEPGTVGDSELSWSPNGKYVAHSLFVPPTADCHIFINPSDPRDGGISWVGTSPDSFQLTGGARHFTYPPTPKHDYDPHWSPLGTEIAFDHGDSAVIRKGIPGVNADINEHLVVWGSFGPENRGANMPTISPDGEWVAYTFPEPGFTNVWIVALKDTAVKVKLTEGRQVSYPQWSPDGAWIFGSSGFAVGNTGGRAVLRG